MRLFTALVIYRFVLPLVFVAAFPGWVVKMLRRGGLTTRLGERVAIYSLPIDHEPSGVVHIHAVSVGESMLALKLIRAWQVEEPGRRFVLSTGTATGHAVASGANIHGLRVTYSPLDFPSMVRRYLDRFEPSQVVLIEGEAWPHLLLECSRRNIPVRLVNARMSPRSARRFQRFASWLRPIYRQLDAVAIQEPEDAAIWEMLGVAAPKIHHTGSLKFDPGSGHRPTRRNEFQEMLDAIGQNRPVILAASTHPGEDAWIVRAICEACPEALAVLVPRHAERRADVKAELEAAGHQVVLRSSFSTRSLANPHAGIQPVFVVDSTGELADWTAHADVVVIGKSFLSVGGQNPCEAILAGKPVVFGPHMENFQPLADRLVASGGAISAGDQNELAQALTKALDPDHARAMTAHATALIQAHDGATQRILAVLAQENSGSF